jgi:hypothetical protein
MGIIVLGNPRINPVVFGTPEGNLEQRETTTYIDKYAIANM